MKEHSQIVIDANTPGVESLLFILSRMSDPNYVNEIADNYFNSGPCLEKSEVKLNRMKFGMFSIHDIMYILIDYKSKNELTFSVNGLMVKYVIDRLNRFGLITLGEIPNISEYKITENLMKIFYDLGLAHNIVFGVPFMIEKLSLGIPAINVKSRSGDIECGSGLILKNHPSDSEAWLVTNKHVIFEKTIIEIIAKDQIFSVISGPFFHPEIDLAALRISVDLHVPVIPIDDDPPVLTPVVAIGYPCVPYTDGQFLMAHRGEVNGKIVSLMGEEFLAISCQVSPGNSGGPIVTESGFCAGIVTQSGIGEFGGIDQPTGVHRTTYHMAIPPNAVSSFINKLNAL